MSQSTKKTGLLSVMLCTIMACGGSSATKKSTTTTASAAQISRFDHHTPGWALFPADTFLVVHLSLEAFRKAPAFDSLTALLERSIASQKLGADRANTIARVDQIDLGLLEPKAGSAQPDTALVIRGRFEKGELSRILSSQGETQAATALTTETRQGMTVYGFKDAEVWTRGVELDANTWLVASGERIDDLIGRVQGVKSLFEPSVAALVQKGDQVDIKTAALGCIVDMKPTIRQRLREQWASTKGESGEIWERDVDGLQWATLGVSLLNGFSVKAIAQMASEERANEVTGRLQKQLDRARGNMIVAMMGATPILSKASATNQGSKVSLGLTATTTEISALLERVSGFLALAQQDTEGPAVVDPPVTSHDGDNVLMSPAPPSNTDPAPESTAPVESKRAKQNLRTGKKRKP